MKTYFMLFLTWACAAFTSQGVFSPVQTLPSSYTDGVAYLFPSYNSRDNTVFMTWVDTQPNNNAWYAIYDLRSGSFSSNPTMLTTSGDVDSIVTSSYNSKDNTVFITWFDSNDISWYVIYDCTLNQLIGAPKVIPTSFGLATNELGAFECYNSYNNTVFMSWPIAGANPHPAYIIYDCSSDSFSTPELISNYFKVGGNIIPTYISKNNSIALTWCDDTNDNNPYFAIFDCDTNTLSKEPTQIAKHKYLLGVDRDVWATVIPHDNQIFMSWNQQANDGGVWYVRYDFENNRFLEDPVLVPNTQTGTTAPQADVIPCYYPSTHQVFLSYSSTTGNNFILYDCKTQTITGGPSLMPSSNAYPALDNITPIFLSKERSLFLSWVKNDGTYPGVFSLYTDKKVGLRKLTSQQNPVSYQQGL